MAEAKKDILGQLFEEGCPCDGWQQNWAQIKGIFVVGWVHGQKYTGAEFEYCPWCGTNLEQFKEDSDGKETDGR